MILTAPVHVLYTQITNEDVVSFIDIDIAPRDDIHKLPEKGILKKCKHVEEFSRHGRESFEDHHTNEAQWQPCSNMAYFRSSSGCYARIRSAPTQERTSITQMQMDIQHQPGYLPNCCHEDMARAYRSNSGHRSLNCGRIGGRATSSSTENLIRRSVSNMLSRNRRSRSHEPLYDRRNDSARSNERFKDSSPNSQPHQCPVMCLGWTYYGDDDDDDDDDEDEDNDPDQIRIRNLEDLINQLEQTARRINPNFTIEDIQFLETDADRRYRFKIPNAGCCSGRGEEFRLVLGRFRSTSRSHTPSYYIAQQCSSRMGSAHSNQPVADASHQNINCVVAEIHNTNEGDYSPSLEQSASDELSPTLATVAGQIPSVQNSRHDSPLVADQSFYNSNHSDNPPSVHSEYHRKSSSPATNRAGLGSGSFFTFPDDPLMASEWNRTCSVSSSNRGPGASIGPGPVDSSVSVPSPSRILYNNHHSDGLLTFHSESNRISSPATTSNHSPLNCSTPFVNRTRTPSLSRTSSMSQSHSHTPSLRRTPTSFNHNASASADEDSSHDTIDSPANENSSLYINSVKYSEYKL